MSFYKWYREVGYLGDDQNARAKIAYEAGAQSRQSEVDDLIDMVKTSADSEMYLFDELQKVNKDRNDLQKRIDEAVEYADGVHSESWQETISTMLYILKGNKNG